MNDKDVRISFMQLLNDYIDDLKNNPAYKTAKNILNIDKDSKYVINSDMFEYSNDKRKDMKEENALISETKKIGKNILKEDKKGYSNYEKLYNSLNHHPAFKAFFEHKKLKKGDMLDFGNHIAEFKTKSMENHEKHNAKQQATKQQTQKEIETLKGENKEKTKKIKHLENKLTKKQEEIENIREKAEQDKAEVKAYYKERYNKKEAKLTKMKKNLEKEINAKYDEKYANALAEHKKEQQEEILKLEKEQLDKKYETNYQRKVEMLKRDKEKQYNIDKNNIEYEYIRKNNELNRLENQITRGDLISGATFRNFFGNEAFEKYFPQTQINKGNAITLDQKTINDMRAKIRGEYNMALIDAEDRKEVTEEDLENLRKQEEKEKEKEWERIQKEVESGKRTRVLNEVDFINFEAQLYEERQKALEEAKETIKQKEAEFEEWKKQNVEEQKQALNEIDAKYNAQIEDERKQAEEDKRKIKADANRDKNEKIAQIKHKMEERHEKDKEELLEETQRNQKEIYGFAPNLEAYIKTKLASKAYSLDEDELIDKIARDIGKPGGLPAGTDPKRVAKAIYDRGAEETMKHIKKIANLAILTGYNNDLYNKLPGDVAQEVQKYITDKINDDIRKKNIKYILPKDKPRWEYAMQNKQLNPMLGRSAWRVN